MELDKSMGKTWILRIVKFYSLLWFSTYGRLPIVTNYGKLGKLLKPYKDNYSEYQLALMLMQYFEWYGVSGDDEFQHRRLQQNTFPLEWFKSYADPIAVFLSEVIDDEKQVERLVNNKLKEMNGKI